MKIIKRDGHIVDYCPEKIENAIMKANAEVEEEEKVSTTQIKNIIKYIEGLGKKRMLVEDIQDIIETKLMSIGKYTLAKKYITYRYTRELVRKSNTTDLSIKELIDGESEYWSGENSNKNGKVVNAQRDYIAGITSTDITRRFLLSDDIVKAHDEGIIHFHSMDYFAQNALVNCSLINLDDMLQNGTNINGVIIEKPHRFLTAVTIATQLASAINSCEYGGATITLTHLAPFVRESYKRLLDKYKKREFSKEDCEKYAKQDLKREITDGVQTFQYQINSMITSNGRYPFLSVCMYLGETKEYKEELAMIIEEMLKQRIEGIKNEKGIYITPAFPKLIYVLEEDNIYKDSKYYYLTKLAAECSAKRLSPDFISEKVMKEITKNKYDNKACYPCMGYRLFLTPDRFSYLGNIAKAKNYKEKEPKYYGRFNQGVVTLNLVDLALTSDKDKNMFWQLMDERLELCHRALQARHKRLSKVTSDVAPILWQYGGLARLEKGQSIHELLHHGYSTMSLGYAGLYECTKYMTDHSHVEEGGKDFALEVLTKLNDACNKWKDEEDIDYVVSATPVESVTYKFAKSLREKFGRIRGITDRDYITNSYHIPVYEKIDGFTKLKLEKDFQDLSFTGAISYIETSDLTKDLDTYMKIIEYIYDNIMYAGINAKSDYCGACSYSGEITLDDELNWHCPKCGNDNHKDLYVVRRSYGWVGNNFWDEKKTREIKDRTVHINGPNS